MTEKLTKNQYAAYLQSDLWKTNRDYLRQFPYYRKCCACGSAKVSLHHSDYKYLGPIYFPPNFIWPLCADHHAEIHDAISKDVNLYVATHDFLNRHDLPAFPGEHLTHIETVKGALNYLKDSKIAYLSLGNRPHYICQSEGETFILRVSTLHNPYDYEFLKDINFPVRKAVMIREGNEYLIYNNATVSVTDSPVEETIL